MGSRIIDMSMIIERVLLVDDDINLLSLLNRYMSLFGLEADQAKNGREALGLLQSREYGVVITDMVMPEMDGMALISHIREHHPLIDVLVVSGQTKSYSFTDLITAGATDFIAKPFGSDELKAKLQRIFRERALIADLARTKEEEKLFFLHLVESLAVSLDEKDRYTHGHSRRVTNLSLQLAEHVTGEQGDLELLTLCGILHDIGKIGIPDNILTKSGKLSAEECEIIKKHPEKGAHILQPLKSDGRVFEISKIIRHHHERFDGKGYPDGLTGVNIPLFSRLIAIADSYDAMTSDRPYRKGLDVDAALEEIRKNAGSQFDPFLADKFIYLMQDYQSGSPCPRLIKCVIFKKITKNDISRAYEMQYCRANFKVCARYKIKEKNRPDNLLPDGSFITASMKKEQAC